MKTHLTIMMIIAALGVSACEKKDSDTVKQARERLQRASKSRDSKDAEQPVTKSGPDPVRMYNITTGQLILSDMKLKDLEQKLEEETSPGKAQLLAPDVKKARDDFASQREETRKYRDELVEKIRSLPDSDLKFSAQDALNFVDEKMKRASDLRREMSFLRATGKREEYNQKYDEWKSVLHSEPH